MFINFQELLNFQNLNYKTCLKLPFTNLIFLQLRIIKINYADFLIYIKKLLFENDFSEFNFAVWVRNHYPVYPLTEYLYTNLY